MSVLLEFTVDNDDFALGEVLGSADVGVIELERIVPSGETVMPFFWTERSGKAELEASVEGSDYIENLTVLDRVGDRTLYRVAWTGEYEDLIEGITATEGTILEARGNEEWFFRLRFLDHQHVADFYNFCTEHAIPVRVGRVYTLTEESLQGRMFDLTEEQRDALLLALRRGYFATPRGVTMDDLADELGISQQAFSERLRRGEEKILENVLLATGGR
ncbi:helix-turn-helix domain-containing protein [Halobacteriaceae archaeon GCM10025711]